jgi:hypothetical protein
MWLLGFGREREGCQGARGPAGGLAHARWQEGRDFLLNFCLIRLIHLLSIYREVYLTPKQGLLDPKQTIRLTGPGP